VRCSGILPILSLSTASSQPHIEKTKNTLALFRAKN